jgi:hypothetical protein
MLVLFHLKARSVLCKIVTIIFHCLPAALFGLEAYWIRIPHYGTRGRRLGNAAFGSKTGFQDVRCKVGYKTLSFGCDGLETFADVSDRPVVSISHDPKNEGSRLVLQTPWHDVNKNIPKKYDTTLERLSWIRKLRRWDLSLANLTAFLRCYILSHNRAYKEATIASFQLSGRKHGCINPGR